MVSLYCWVDMLSRSSSSTDSSTPVIHSTNSSSLQYRQSSLTSHTPCISVLYLLRYDPIKMQQSIVLKKVMPKNLHNRFFRNSLLCSSQNELRHPQCIAASPTMHHGMTHNASWPRPQFTKTPPTILAASPTMHHGLTHKFTMAPPTIHRGSTHNSPRLHPQRLIAPPSVHHSSAHNASRLRPPLVVAPPTSGCTASTSLAPRPAGRASSLCLPPGRATVGPTPSASSPSASAGRCRWGRGDGGHQPTPASLSGSTGTRSAHCCPQTTPENTSHTSHHIIIIENLLMTTNQPQMFQGKTVTNL